jgi:hypothetical protein
MIMKRVDSMFRTQSLGLTSELLLLIFFLVTLVTSVCDAKGAVVILASTSSAHAEAERINPPEDIVDDEVNIGLTAAQAYVHLEYDFGLSNEYHAFGTMQARVSPSLSGNRLDVSLEANPLIPSTGPNANTGMPNFFLRVTNTYSIRFEVTDQPENMTLGKYNTGVGGSDTSILSGPLGTIINPIFLGSQSYPVGVYDYTITMTDATSPPHWDTHVSKNVNFGMSASSEIQIVPEPSTLALLGMGAIGILAYCRRW